MKMGQGNIFASVCHSGHEREGPLYDVTACLAAWSHVPPGGVASVPGPCDRDPCIDNGSHRSGWYAS